MWLVMWLVADSMCLTSIMPVALRQDIFNLSGFHTLAPNVDLSILSPRKTNSHVGIEFPKISSPPNTPGLKLPLD